MSVVAPDRGQTEDQRSFDRSKSADKLRELSMKANGDEVAELEPEAACCPRCNSTTSWKGGSWCPDCGYYPGITEIAPQKLPEPEEEEETEPVEAPPLVAPWIIRLIVINSAIIGFSIAARYYFTFIDASFRGLLAFTMVVAGMITCFVNQLRAGFATMKENADASPMDAITCPIETWRTTLQGLPKTSSRIIWFLAGLTTLASGQFIVGGIDYGAIFRHEREEAKQPDVFQRVVTNLKDDKPKEDDKPRSEGVESLESMEEEIAAARMPSSDEPLECFIYGYMKDGEETFGRLLLGAEIQGERRHVAMLQPEDLSEQQRQILFARLEPLQTETTEIPSMFVGATWVSPSVGLDLEFAGWTFGGEMKEPKLHVPAAPVRVPDETPVEVPELPSS